MAATSSFSNTFVLASTVHYENDDCHQLAVPDSSCVVGNPSGVEPTRTPDILYDGDGCFSHAHIVMLRRVFPFSARTYGTEPRMAALVVMFSSLCLGMLGVFLYTSGALGSSCQSQLTEQFTNPRTFCLQRTLQEAERAKALPAHVVADVPYQGPTMFLLRMPLSNPVLKEVLQNVCANQTGNVTYFYRKDRKEHVINGTTFPIAAYQATDAYRGLRLRCASSSFALFDSLEPPLSFTAFVFVSNRVSLSPQLMNRMALEDEWWAFIANDAVEQRLTYPMHGATLSTPSLLSNDAVSFATAQLCRIAAPPSSYKACHEFLHTSLQFQGMSPPAASMLSLSKVATLYYPSSVLSSTNTLHYTLREGNIGVFCQDTDCDSVVIRFADALAVFITAFAIVGFFVRTIPGFHLTIVQAESAAERLLPIEASAIGKRPRWQAVSAMMLIQFVVILVGVLWVFLDDSQCIQTFALAARNPRAGCVERALTSFELQNVFGETEQRGAIQCVTSTNGRIWEGQCPPRLGAAEAPRGTGLFDMKMSFRKEEGLTRLGEFLCPHALATNTVMFTNLNGSTGVEFRWPDATDGMRVVRSRTMEHLDGEVVQTCVAKRWAIVELRGQVSRTVLIGLDSALSSTKVWINPDDLTREWYAWLPIEESTAAILRRPLDQTKLLAPLRMQSDGLYTIRSYNATSDRAEMILNMNMYAPAGGNRDTIGLTAAGIDGAAPFRIHGIQLLVPVDFFLMTALSQLNGTSQQIGTHMMESFESISLHTVEADECLNVVVAMTDGNGAVSVHCSSQQCLSLGDRVAKVCGIGFAVLTLAMFFIRLFPACHTLDEHTTVEFTSLRSTYWQQLLFSLYPTAGTPRNSKPKPWMLLLILVQFCFFVAAFVYAGQDTRCLQGFDVTTDFPRIGCAQNPLSASQRQLIFGSTGTTTTLRLQQNITVSEGDTWLLSMKALGEAMNTTTGLHTVISLLCTQPSAQPLSISSALLSNGDATVTLNGTRTLRFAQSLSISSMTAANSIPHACGAEDWAVWQQQDIVYVVLARVRDVQGRFMLECFEPLWHEMVSRNERHLVATQVLQHGIHFEAPFTVTTAPASATSFVIQSTVLPTGLLNNEWRLAQLSFGANMSMLWGGAASRAQLGDALQSATTLSLRQALPRTANFSIALTDPHVPLFCVVEVCVAYFSRLSSSLAIAITATSLMVFIARNVRGGHDLLPLRPRVRASINVAPKFLLQYKWISEADMATLGRSAPTSSSVEMVNVT